MPVTLSNREMPLLGVFCGICAPEALAEIRFDVMRPVDKVEAH